MSACPRLLASDSLSSWYPTSCLCVALNRLAANLQRSVFRFVALQGVRTFFRLPSASHAVQTSQYTVLCSHDCCEGDLSRCSHVPDKTRGSHYIPAHDGKSLAEWISPNATAAKVYGHVKCLITELHVTKRKFTAFDCQCLGFSCSSSELRRQCIRRPKTFGPRSPRCEEKQMEVAGRQ